MAGSKWIPLDDRVGYLRDSFRWPVGVANEFTADDTDGTIPVLPIPEISGLLCGIDVAFDTGVTPDSVTINITTADDISLPGFPATALTANGRISVSPAVPFAGGLNVKATTNTVNSAKGIVTLLVF